MRMILYIAWHDFRKILSERESQMWIFLMPLLFIYFIGTATAPRPAGIPRLGLLNEDQAFLSAMLAESLTSFGYEVVEVKDRENLSRYGRQLVVPAGFTERVLKAQATEVELSLQAEQGSGSQFDQVKVQRALFQFLSSVIRAAAAPDGRLDETSIRAAAALPKQVTLEVADEGRRVQPPSGFEQAVPGILVMFVLMAVLTSGTVQLVMERESGLLRRLASAPATRRQIVLGKLSGRLAVAVLQTSYMMLIGRYLFSMDWGRHLPSLLVLLLAYAMSVTALGVWLSTVIRTVEQGIGIGVVTSLGMAALGGAWWPIEVVPRYLQYVAAALPTGWTMDGVHKLVSFGYGPESIVFNVAALLAAAGVFSLLAARSFRFT